MDLRSITYFVKIAAVGSIARAADQLGLAQSALSRRVRIIENELGTRLLIRAPRGIRMTSAGLQFLGHCQRVIRELTLVKEELRVRKEVPRGNVTLGISPTIGPLLLPGTIERAQQQCPYVRLRIVEGYSPTLFDALLAGQLDLAVLMNPPATRALTLRPLVSEPIVVLTPQQPRNARRFFTLAELAKTPLIVSAGSREIIEDQLRRIDAKLNVQIEVSAIEPIRRLLLRGIGITALPVSTFHDDIVAGRITPYPIVDGNFQRTLHIAYPAEGQPSAAVEEILQILVAETNVLIDLGIFNVPIFRQIKRQTKRLMSKPKPVRKNKR